MEDHLSIQEREISGITILDISGRIDAATSSHIEGELGKKIDTGVTTLILNMKDLSYISSSGLRVILAALKRVKAEEGTIALAALQPGPGEVFKMTGFDRLFPISPSVEQAVEKLKS
ncbi:STAS domain-containing protein [Methanospirillum hungatei]|jgi:anti-sigma B factor antagonist|uniref:STAS domain-containing protein n=1 Tax=Methanospirillum hungatei TaxID=2203 RepID=UPI001B6C123F|nr:STAS domain-containing protein [Methanospirillum hungatei]MBP7034220.1 STAS domain-containing protein [Methanospirillum sp.]MBP9007657.1 STAS domain-containing protein [Methanospirillum sp.]HOW04551.1 STAS domain-containing protein [Methanospirillum hungatei]